MGKVLMGILIATTLIVGIFVGNAIVPPLVQSGNCTIAEPKVCPKCNVTDTSSIQRAFQRCFTDFDSSHSTKTCINYLRFKDCINTAMGRFK